MEVAKEIVTTITDPHGMVGPEVWMTTCTYLLPQFYSIMHE